MTDREPPVIRNVLKHNLEGLKTREWLQAYDKLSDLFEDVFGNNDTEELRRIGTKQPTCAIMRYAIMKRMLDEKGVSMDLYPEYHQFFPDYIDYDAEEWERYLLYRYGSRGHTP